MNESCDHELLRQGKVPACLQGNCKQVPLTALVLENQHLPESRFTCDVS